MRPHLKAKADAAQVRKEQMIELHTAGMSYQQIGKTFGVTRSRVQQLIQSGLAYRERNTPPGSA